MINHALTLYALWSLFMCKYQYDCLQTEVEQGLPSACGLHRTAVFSVAHLIALYIGYNMI